MGMKGSTKVLLIDDNENITKMLTKYLKMKGFDVTYTNDGRNGLSQILTGNFDIVLLDLAMPEFNGYDVLDELENKGKMNGRIVVLTASSVKTHDTDELMRRGCRCILRKPVQLKVLLNTIQNIDENTKIKKTQQLTNFN